MVAGDIILQDRSTLPTNSSVILFFSGEYKVLCENGRIGLPMRIELLPNMMNQGEMAANVLPLRIFLAALIFYLAIKFYPSPYNLSL